MVKKVIVGVLVLGLSCSIGAMDQDRDVLGQSKEVESVHPFSIVRKEWQQYKDMQLYPGDFDIEQYKKEKSLEPLPLPLAMKFKRWEKHIEQQERSARYEDERRAAEFQGALPVSTTYKDVLPMPSGLSLAISKWYCLYDRCLSKCNSACAREGMLKKEIIDCVNKALVADSVDEIAFNQLSSRKELLEVEMESIKQELNNLLGQKAEYERLLEGLGWSREDIFVLYNALKPEHDDSIRDDQILVRSDLIKQCYEWSLCSDETPKSTGNE